MEFLRLARAAGKDLGISDDMLKRAVNVGFSGGEKKRAEMVQRANGGSTFPQIFIGDDHIGGCDEMMALERAGKLDALLAA